MLYEKGPPVPTRYQRVHVAGAADVFMWQAQLKFLEETIDSLSDMVATGNITGNTTTAGNAYPA